MLIVADVIVTPNDLTELFKQWGQPAKVIWASQYRPPEVPGVNMELCPEIARLTDSRFDDVIYLGVNPDRVEALFQRSARRDFSISSSAANVSDETSPSRMAECITQESV